MPFPMIPAHVVQWISHSDATCAVTVVQRFNPIFGPVRHVCLLKVYFIIIPMHVMIGEIIPGR